MCIAFIGYEKAFGFVQPAAVLEAVEEAIYCEMLHVVTKMERRVLFFQKPIKWKKRKRHTIFFLFFFSSLENNKRKAYHFFYHFFQQPWKKKRNQTGQNRQWAQNQAESCSWSCSPKTSWEMREMIYNNRYRTWSGKAGPLDFTRTRKESRTSKHEHRIKSWR